MIDLQYESEYYARDAERSLRVVAALSREDVRQAILSAPDANGLSASTDLDGCVQITLFVNVGEDPALVELAGFCDTDHYRVDLEQLLLDDQDVRVAVKVQGRAKLTREDKRLLRSLGKLRTERSRYTSLSCAA
jgi:hypothetical protein